MNFLKAALVSGFLLGSTQALASTSSYAYVLQGTSINAQLIDKAKKVSWTRGGLSSSNAGGELVFHTKDGKKHTFLFNEDSVGDKFNEMAIWFADGINKGTSVNPKIYLLCNGRASSWSSYAFYYVTAVFTNAPQPSGKCTIKFIRGD